MNNEYGDNEPVPQPSNNELTGSYPNMKTSGEINTELGKMHPLEKELQVPERKGVVDVHLLAEKIRMSGNGSYDPLHRRP